jgi:prophage regulatory protein
VSGFPKKLERARGFELPTPTLARRISIDFFTKPESRNPNERPICSLQHPRALPLSNDSSISPPVYVSCSRADQVGRDQTSENMRATRPTTSFLEPEADRRSEQPVLDTAPLVPHRFKRAIRRSELHQIVPLADTTIYELEQRGQFPRRFYLTSRCVVWDLSEVEAWLEERRRASREARFRRAPSPDVRQRKTRPVRQ